MHQPLQAACLSPKGDGGGNGKEEKNASEVESSEFENYFETLEVDDDYFPDEGTYVPEPSSLKLFKVDRQKILKEAFAMDMRLELVYFFGELEELGEQVFEMYKPVKKQQRTMVEATMVI
ncbi:hypothetical protein F441_10156 [Phytophthora nicotianae CJ01A1]|uniref:DUF6604 domain-containing protein n=4 Tax=Phytophthora nicotianae TaxID=4792 RepID=V9F2Z0_PHYNI|nr:hypothetical protein F443_10222 [Phytophthora nicotianae P1569]ETO73780.1 hypothetical protein F444_10319 [Phytophthora nicotianae P1976]ETP14947.1 hypothetical protein F441_10156 [Phytophthora nicotianae CJ01A1]